MKLIYQLILLLVFLCPAGKVSAQLVADSIVVDTLAKKEKKGGVFGGRPGKAMVMSLIIPGTGQIYNKSYLRVPFVWGAVGGMGYLVWHNTRQYNCLSDAYVASIDGVPYTPPEWCSGLSSITNPNQLRALRDEANANRQLSIVGLSLVWIANGIDAFVNAHLKEFDVNENLTIDFGTRMDNDPNSPMRMGIFVQF